MGNVDSTLDMVGERIKDKTVFKVELPRAEINLAKETSSITHKIMAQVAAAEDKMLIEAIVKYASENGFNEALIIDEKFVKTALEKQIPKKPMQGKTGEIIDGYCPNCCSKQLMGDRAWHRTFNKYCIECGQALDWSDT